MLAVECSQIRFEEAFAVVGDTYAVVMLNAAVTTPDFSYFAVRQCGSLEGFAPSRSFLESAVVQVDICHVLRLGCCYSSPAVTIAPLFHTQQLRATQAGMNHISTSPPASLQ